MRFHKTVLFALSLTVLASAAQSVQAQQKGKIAVVDLQRAINETEDGRQAQRRLKTLFEKRQKELDKAQQDLKTQKEAIEKQADVLSQDALRKKAEAYQESLMALQTEYVEYQKELTTKEGELTNKIIVKMQEILKRMGQTEGYQMIIERNEGGVIWAPNNLDITDVLIQKYNAQAKTKK